MSAEGIRYVHDAAISAEARAFQQQLFDSKAKGLFAAAITSSVDPQLLKTFAGVDSITSPAKIPSSLTDYCDLVTERSAGRDVWRLTPKSGGSGKVIFYIHGGGYVLNITSAHWDYLEQLCKGTGATLIVPDYPLAPQYTADEAYACVEDAYDRTLQTTDPQKVFIMGDSAGGGLSLGLALKLRDARKPLPGGVIVLSPWLDVTLVDLDIDAVEDRDHFLGTRGLVKAGLAYAGKRDPKDPSVSPFYGEFEGLPPISIFQGTHDIFVVNSRKLVARLESEGHGVNYFEYPGHCHIWAVFPTPESKVAVGQMVDLIKS